MRERRTVVAGHCTIDDIHQADGAILPKTPGGAAAYATLGAAMYGGSVTLVSLLGDDYPFERFRAGLARYGNVDLSGVRRAAPRSIHNLAMYREDGARQCDIESWEIMEHLTPRATDLAPYVLENAIVLLAPASLLKQLESVRMVRARECEVAIDTEIHYIPSLDQKACLRAVVAEATYFLPSIEHLQVLYANPSRDITLYLDDLFTLGCPWIVVKEGRRGSTLIDCREARTWHVPAVRDLTVRDVTGAGDGFNGGFTAALANGKDTLDAACWGTVTASFVVESIGAAMPLHFDRTLALARYNRVRAGLTEIGDSKRAGNNPQATRREG
ncbi:MAG: carbohydrate kinase family protein [Chloroflexota bacterium]